MASFSAAFSRAFSIFYEEIANAPTVSTEEHYLYLLQSLLPQGPAWSRDDDALLTKILTAFADEFARVDLRVNSLLDEADPRTTNELLDDWERVAGLPDPCVVGAQTLAQRQAALTSKLISQGGQSKSYFIDMATQLGYVGATIDEFRPMTCNDTCNDALFSELDRFVWVINLPDTGATYIATCNDPCDSPLQAWGDEVIECRINHYKPAHTIALFAYS